MSAAAALVREDRNWTSAPIFERIRGHLMACAVGAGNDGAFATMIASQAVGRGVLPPGLGLAPADYRSLLDHHFHGVDVSILGTARDRHRLAAVPAVSDPREAEHIDLVCLLLMHTPEESPSAVWMAQIVAAACMGHDHLWQDLGLQDRTELSALMQRNFPALAARNVKDMKWKRFLYKQLCEMEGIHACRAPSCEICTDHADCFGPDG